MARATSITPRAPKGEGINAHLSRAGVGDVFWIETEAGKHLTGYLRTGRKVTQEAFWAVGKQSGTLLTLLRVEVTEIVPDAPVMDTLDPIAEELANMLRRLASLTERANAIQHGGETVEPEDWSELHDLTNEAKALLAKRTPTP